MMIDSRPKFMDSEYFIMEPNNWHLEEGAPEEVVEEFNEFMKSFGYMNKGIKTGSITRKEAKAVHKDLPEGGVWRTIKGHHVYIKDGKVLAGSIPGVTKPKKATKEHLKAHQEHIDKEAKKNAPKKKATKSTGTKGKANGTTKTVGAKKDAKSTAKPTAKSKPTGKPVSATGKKKSASEGGAKGKPAAKAGGGHYELYHGTKLWSVDEIMKNGFEVNGHAEDFGNAAYFKSPQFDDLDRKDMEDWKKEMEAKGRNISEEDRNNKDGYDTTKIVRYFAGSGNNSAVIKASIAKEHVVDCTKGRPKELESILKDYYKAQGDYVDLMKLAMKHILKMKNPTDEDAEDDRLTWELEQAWGKRFNTRETSPYEIYAKGYGVKAIIDKLDSFTSEGWQIGVYDPKIIKVHDHGWGIERSSRGVDLLKALMKALNGRNPGHCLLHFEMTDEGLVMHIGAIGKGNASEEVKKSIMATVMATGSGDVTAEYQKELRKFEVALQKGLITLDHIRKLGADYMGATEAGRNAYRIDWTQVNPNDSILYIPLNRLRRTDQTEKATNWDKVEENRGKMARGEGLAPIVIGYDYDIKDGQHRWEASNLEGFTHVPCIVMRGTNEIERERAVEAYQEVWKSIVTDPTAPHQYDNEGFMFRGIGLRELHAINKSKVIQSKGKGNDDDKGTNTCFSNLFRQAEGYARSQYDLYDEQAAFVLVVNRVSWIEEDEHGELISDRPIPSTNIYDIIPVPKEDIVKGFDESKHPRDAAGKFSKVEMDIDPEMRPRIVQAVKHSKPFGKGAKVPVKNLKNPLEQTLRDATRAIVKEFKKSGDNRQPFDRDMALSTIANLKKMGFRRMKDGDDDSHAAYGVEYRVNPKKALLMTVHIGKAGYDFASVHVNVYRYKEEANFDPTREGRKRSNTYFMGIR